MEEKRIHCGQEALRVFDTQIMEGLLELKGMRFKAFHGCLPEERVEGGEYLVDFSVKLPLERAALSDNLADTLDYSRVYSLIQKELQQPSNLIENVAARIAASLRAEFPQLAPFTLRLTKLAPPLGGACEGASITLIG